MTPVEAGAEIMGLVCGFPGRKGARRGLMVVRNYKGFFDGSGTGSPDFYIMAGYVAPAESWATFSIEWQELLDMRPHLEAFKMSDMAQSEERLERASWFYRLIERHVSAAVSCVIPVQPMLRAFESIEWPNYISPLDGLKNPYFFGIKGLTSFLIRNQKALGIDEPIDFIFDTEAISAHVQGGWDYLKLQYNAEERALLGDPPSYRNDIKTMPLQAADLYAWWVRKWALEGDSESGVRDLKFPWKVDRMMIPRFNVEYTEDEFRVDYEGMCTPEAKRIVNMLNPKEELRQIEKEERGIGMTIPDPSSPFKF